MLTKIALKDIVFAYHGYYDSEQIIGHTFVVDIEVDIDQIVSTEDQIQATVNYEVLYQICSDAMKNRKKLIESVGEEIALQVKNHFPEIIKGSVTISKQSPQLGGKVGCATIQINF